jgi:hypothetical protein
LLGVEHVDANRQQVAGVGICMQSPIAAAHVATSTIFAVTACVFCSPNHPALFSPS